jgi:light-regulated signal transduction histidine kinase (bacteriophytochrome)
MLTAAGRAGEHPPGLSNCEREPIHTPGSVQPHGALFVLAGGDHRVLQASENAAALLGLGRGGVVGRPLADLLGADAARALGPGLAAAPAGVRPVFLGTVTAGEPGRAFHAVAHRTDGGTVLELEPAPPTVPGGTPDVHPLLDAFSLRAEAARGVEELSRLACEEIRRYTGFDRVLVYRFDPEWNGTVIGEDGSGRLPSYLHHRFPASDVPAQARELYRLNRVRIIPDADYRPVPVVPTDNPITGRPLDMSHAVLRSVSPVHVEYMKNMETAASMSVSILRDGRLWGLVACHHKEPKTVPFPVRGACDLVARAFSLRLSALEHAEDYERRIQVRSVYARLLAAMADRGDFAAALAERADDLLAFADAAGAAIVTADGCRRFGDAPTEGQVRELADWLFATAGEVYSTDALAAAFPPAGAYKGRASGVLAVAVSKLYPSYVLWFRPEVIRTVVWGGDPTKPAEGVGDRVRLHPRKSFETWRETVRDRSLPWDPSEVEAAVELRNAIVGIVLRRAEEVAELNAELTRSNKELEAFSYSVSHDLRAPLRHIVGYAEMLREDGAGQLSPRAERCIATIIESSEYAGRLVDKLLGYSRLGRADLQRTTIDVAALVAEVRKDVMRDAGGRTVTWRVGDLPPVVADLMMLRMAVRDLLSNAVKYTRGRDEAVIEVGCRADGAEYVFSVKDNGVGFDMAYADKLFGVFQRLHRWEDYEGTGIGLANVRRVVERHGGRTWAEGREGVGATFYFTLPRPAG